MDFACKDRAEAWYCTVFSWKKTGSAKLEMEGKDIYQQFTAWGWVTDVQYQFKLGIAFHKIYMN